MGNITMTERQWAAWVLEEVAALGHAGHFPPDISAFDLGRALSRLCINSQEGEGDMGYVLCEIERGWNHTNANRRNN